MSTDNAPNSNNSNNGEMYARNRRGSITQAALTNLFQRGNSVPTGSGFPPQSNSIDANRRRLSVTTLGLSGTSPSSAQPFVIRRGSLSTNSNNSDSIDESAIEDDDMWSSAARTAPNTPFVRRMSFNGPPCEPPALAAAPEMVITNLSSLIAVSSPNTEWTEIVARGASSQGSSISAAWSAVGRRASTILPASSLPQASNTKYPRAPSDSYPSRPDQQGFNWSEQLRSRAESSVTSTRPSFSLASGSPPRGNSMHDRAKSVSEMPMPQPPVQAAAVRPKQERPKPDAFQERILKGDFYMD